MDFSIHTLSFNVPIWSLLVTSRVDIQQNILYVNKYMYVLFSYLKFINKISVSSSSVRPTVTQPV